MFRKYIVGTYDLEILTLPRIYMKDVKITQSNYTYIDIPGSGMLRYSTPKPIIAQLFIKGDSGEYVWVYDMDPTQLNGRLFLQPGDYKIVYRIKDAKSTDYTAVKTFRIMSGENTQVNL